MSRHRPQTSIEHTVKYLRDGSYEIGWVVDRYYAGHRQRFPTRYSRVTDKRGAERFCRKHDCEMPATS